MRAVCLVLLLAGCAGQTAVTVAPDGPQMRAEVPGTGVQTVLTPAGQNGDTVTWLSADGVSLAFQDGVLVATRGLPGDLMSADATATRAALQRGEMQDYTRFMTYLDGAGGTVFRSMVCTMRLTGPERAVDGTLDTLRHDEECASLTAQVTNSYWLSGDGTAVQTRQWIGDEAGYLVTQQLIR